MVFPLRILRFETSSIRRLLASRWSFVGVLLLLLVVGFTMQNFAVRHSSSDSLDLRRDNILSFLHSVWGAPLPEASLDQQSDQDAPQSPATREAEPEAEPPEDGPQDPGDNPIQPRISSVLSDETCPQISNIVFLKTHKTGSGTIENILYRYAENRRLMLALPRNKFHHFFYPMFFQSDFVEGFSSRNSREFNIMTNHMRFRKSEVSKVMPKDSFYFSILRDPVPMMESMFQFFSPSEGQTSLDQFLDHKLQNYKKPSVNTDFTHNNLAFDFGYDNTATAEARDLEERAEKVIAGIERDFDVVLINEYFDESMILLKKSLCWSLEDVISFKLNSRAPPPRGPPPALSTETADKIRRWNALDWKIYLHFNQSFWERLRTHVGLGKVRREVAQLRDLQTQLARTCLKDGGPVKPTMIKEAGLKPFQGADSVILGYNLKADLDQQTEARCLRLITPELTYTHTLYNLQFPEKDGDK